MNETTLAGRIAAASKDVGGKLSTDKRNMEQKYDYISADKVLSICGQALADQGVVILPSITSETIEAMDRGAGKARYDAVVHFAFIVTDGASQFELPWLGRGSDYAVPDKAVYKAVTSGHKYFIAKLLNVGAGNEDGEHEPAEEVQFQRPVAKPAPPSNGHTPPAADRIEKFLDWAAKTHAESDGPATAKQYNFLAGVIDGFTEPGAHNQIFELMVHRPVTSENPIGYGLAKQLLDWLPATSGKGPDKMANPNHKPDVVEIVKGIWAELEVPA